MDSTKSDDDFTWDMEEEMSIPSKVLPTLKTRRRKYEGSEAPKGFRQKFCDRWMEEFPWLRPHPEDDLCGYCNICYRQLVCNMTVIKRHPNSTWHITAMENQKDVENTEFVECGGSENTDEGATADMPDEPEPKSTDLPELKSRRLTQSSELRNKRSTFQSRWLKIFRWLRPHPEDATLVYCAPCNRQLVAAKANLERHETTPRHLENALEKQEMEDADILLAGENSLSSDGAMQGENGDAKEFVETLDSSTDLDRRVSRKRNHSEMEQPEPDYSSYVRVTEDNHPDPLELFFESAKASARKLPPRFAAEIKVRISQIIAEYELRVICEREAEEERTRSGDTKT